MRRLLVVLSILSLQLTFAQPYGNEWINYSQSYYSFQVYQEGIYRIDFASMQSAGIPVASILPSDFQVFGREKEVAIYVNDGGDGSFDSGDYIEFYANKNDAWLDSLIYDDPTHVLNPEYSLYNDTINYYLSWSNGSNSRVSIESDINFASYTAQNYYIHKTRAERVNSYIEGKKQNGLSSSFFTEAEGWSSTPTNGVPGNANQFLILQTANYYTGAGAPDMEVVASFSGASNASYTGTGNHHGRIVAQSTILYDTIYVGYKNIIANFTLPPNFFNSASTSFSLGIVDDQGAASDFQSLSFIEVKYAHTTDFGGASQGSFFAPYNSSEIKSRYDIVNTAITNPVAYALGDVVRKIPVVDNAGTLQMLVPNNVSNENKVFLLDESEVINITSLSPVNGSGNFTDFSLFNSDNFLLITESSLLSSALQYESYRESTSGGAYSVLVADVNELYHQFGGGVQKHAISVRRFAEFFVDNSTVSPEFLFIIGKGIREANESNVLTGQGTRKDATSFANNLVPSFGYPASDMALLSGINGNFWRPVLAVGRLSASSNQEVLDYLSKMQEFELEQDPNSVYSSTTKDWQKQIMHFGGGSNAFEQDQFRFYLQNYESKIEDVRFGGNVYSTYKSTSDPIDPTTSQEVTARINSGTSLMTFFGHASSSGFDQNVDDPSNWSNQGKYPLVIGNACYTGDIFQPSSNSTSERFVVIPNKGAIGFLSSVKLGFAQTLNTYTSELYDQIASTNYGEGIGKQIQETVDAIEAPGSSIAFESTCLGMTLHGDPALKLNWHQKPEFEILPTGMFFEPENINLTVDSITVNLIVTNLGEATDSQFVAVLRRSFPGGGTDSVYTKVINGLHYKDTISFKMPLDPNNGIGQNNFNAKIDIPSQIDEQYDEIFNNEITVPYTIQLDGLYPVWPYPYAVVPGDTITLKASTNNPLAPLNTYIFEIDTTDEFNSPFRKIRQFSSLGGVLEVQYDQWENADNGSPELLILEDSMVYFWRVAVDSSVLVWNESSFQHINGQIGWGQDHFFQFKNNNFRNVEYNRNFRKRLFFPDRKIINCRIFGNSTDFNELLATDWKIDGEVQEYGLCTLTPSLHVAVVDPVTLEAWGTANGGQNPTHSYGNANDGASCRNRVEKYFIFRQNNATSLAAFENMVLNEVPDSHYILIYTTTYADYASWDALYPNTYNVFQSLGSDSIMAGKPNVPFIFFVKKGDLSTAHEEYGSDINDNLILNDTLEGFDFLGTEKSTVIGPAYDWHSVYWKQNPEEMPTSDSTRIRLYGITGFGVESLVLDSLFSLNDSILNLNSIIPATTYPYLKFEAYYKDDVDFTPAQVDSWHVLYQPVPECAVDGVLGYYWDSPDTLSEGMDASAGFRIRNISDYHMDSLLVRYWVEDQDRNIHPISYPRQDSLRVGSELYDTISFNTYGIPGHNILWVEANPYVVPTDQDQPEQFHFNNLAQVPFFVKRDEINPVLDVTFDGTHIMNGDLVSGKAQIVISLNDENMYLLLDSDEDTANFGVYLTDPLGNQTRVPFLGPNGELIMQWFPTVSSENRFKIVYDGNFQMDGAYQLLVQGNDVSGNNSGDLEYRVEFEVINKSTITYLMNYPNPFSTSTRFVFTLTGNEVPDEMTIQILSVSGKLVKTITMDEFGPIKVGHNISEYAWDGRDDWGDQLANGVYLYTVKMRLNGEDIEHRNSGADQFFKKEFGKMYLLR